MADTEIDNYYSDLCASYQQAAFDQLVKTTDKVLAENKYKSFGLSGGVSNNQKIRDDLSDLCKKREVCFLPAPKKYTGDNASMIAYCAVMNPRGLWSNDGQQLIFSPNLKICDLAI